MHLFLDLFHYLPRYKVPAAGKGGPRWNDGRKSLGDGSNEAESNLWGGFSFATMSIQEEKGDIPLSFLVAAGTSRPHIHNYPSIKNSPSQQNPSKLSFDNDTLNPHTNTYLFLGH